MGGGGRGGQREGEGTCSLAVMVSSICMVTGYIFILFYFIYLFLRFNLFLAPLGLRCCVQAFSSCGERELRCGAWASHFSGFSCGARALGAQAQ